VFGNLARWLASLVVEGGNIREVFVPAFRQAESEVLAGELPSARKPPVGMMPAAALYAGGLLIIFYLYLYRCLYHQLMMFLNKALFRSMR
jgi:hypothetical protein